ncbi:hypothetical protein FPSE_02749 [Fusarium pseudograminearum CS3096]|uniref:Uncharacterized protein n=1 Tax=Fusarium pseudograminearum (strain CS3096) TaxID=1028729 RepID=K3W264_FUSPC|nr:hypothetical protein FPSE_02749 [Fusarium pseudograminearum CS3096]EKJ77105.1 hypothetical protein FPSE_02749 [Fusarium pseudograminearum CS3096]
MLGTAKVGRLEVPSSTAYPCAYSKYRASCRAKVFVPARDYYLELLHVSCVDLCYFKAKLRHMIDTWISIAQPPLGAVPHMVISNNPLVQSWSSWFGRDSEFLSSMQLQTQTVAKQVSRLFSPFLHFFCIQEVCPTRISQLQIEISTHPKMRRPIN